MVVASLSNYLSVAGVKYSLNIFVKKAKVGRPEVFNMFDSGSSSISGSMGMMRHARRPGTSFMTLKTLSV